MNKYAEFSKQDDRYSAVLARVHSKDSHQCIKKRLFYSRENAEKFLHKNGYTLRIYQCPQCHMYHTTSRL